MATEAFLGGFLGTFVGLLVVGVVIGLQQRRQFAVALANQNLALLQMEAAAARVALGASAPEPDHSDQAN